QYAIQQPGNLGVLNWGSVSVDIPNNRVFMNDIRVPSLFTLIPRADYVYFALTTTAHCPSAPQRCTPYAMSTSQWPWR
ncbi:hypothetical protein ACC796_36900, partial [Rhizobium ruizarguesonis]